MLQSLSRLWTTADNLTRTAVLLALAVAAVNGATYFGASPGESTGWTYLLHVSVMILGLLVFLRTGTHLFRTVVGPRRKPAPWDRFLVLCTAISIVYLAALTVAVLSDWGEGGAIDRDGRFFWRRNGTIIRELTAFEYERYKAEALRVFSAGWLFFSLALATWNHNFLHRRRADGT